MTFYMDQANEIYSTSVFQDATCNVGGFSNGFQYILRQKVYVMLSCKLVYGNDKILLILLKFCSHNKLACKINIIIIIIIM